MTDRLFVYGTLAPGRPNAHVLADVDGSWELGSVRGHLHEQGWGAALGFPGIILGEDGPEVHGVVLTADSLAEHWDRLDDFEGEGYVRSLVAVRLDNGDQVQAQIYEIDPATLPERA